VPEECQKDSQVPEDSQEVLVDSQEELVLVPVPVLVQAERPSLTTSINTIATN
jgi:hypothetical protein